MARYSKSQLDEFERQYKENRKKGTQNANEILHRENVVAKNIYQDLADAYARQQAKEVPSLKPNPSIGDLKQYDYAVNQTPQISIGDLKRYDYAANQKRQPSIGDLKRYDYAANAPIPKNLTEKGFPSSVKNIDFGALQYSPEHMGNQAGDILSHLGLGPDKSQAGSVYSPEMRDRLDYDLEMRNKSKRWNAFVDASLPDFLKTNPNTDESEDEYRRIFGLSKEAVLDQYEKYKEAEEKKSREEHPFKSGLTDFVSAPDRATMGFLGNMSEWLFPGSDLSNMLNSDLAQSEVRDVQRKRDYTYDSDKLTEGQKNWAKIYNQGGDFVVNSVAAQAIANLIAGVSAIDSLGSATSFINSKAFEESPQIAELVNNGADINQLRAAAQAYAKTQFAPVSTKAATKLAQAGIAAGETSSQKLHDLEKQGIDHDKAVEMAAVSGLLSGGSRYAMAGLGGAVAEGANWLTQALSRGGQAAIFGAAGQSASELAEMLILQEDATYRKEIQNYMQQGMSEKEAGQKAASNILARAGLAGLEGGLFGVGSSLLETGVGSLLNRQTIPGPEDIYVNSDVVNNGPQTLGLPGSQMQGVPGGNAGYIPATTGLPALQAPANVIQMPNTSSGPVIPMPDFSSGPAIQLPDLSNTVNPYLLQGEELENAKATYKENLKTIKALKDEIKIIEGDKSNYRGDKLTKANQARVNERKKQIKALESENKPLYRGIKGKSTPIKELLSKEDYNYIYNYKTPDSIEQQINYLVNYAGKTPEAVQMGKDLKKTIDNFVEAGDALLINDVWEKASALETLARTTNATYVNSGLKHVTDYFGDENNAFANSLINDKALYRAYYLAKERNESEETIKYNPPAPAETPAAGESAPVNPWSNTADSLIAEDSYARGDEYKNLRKQVKDYNAQLDDIWSQKKALEAELKKERVGRIRLSEDDLNYIQNMDIEDRIDYIEKATGIDLGEIGAADLEYLLDGKSITRHTPKGDELQAQIDELLKQHRDIEKLRDIADQDSDYIKAQARLAQLENYKQGDLIPATRDKYQGFSITKGEHNDEIGKGARLVEMTPDEYIRRCAYEIFRGDYGTLESSLTGRAQADIDKYARLMLEGTEFPTPYLDYKTNNQEGLHRALAAKVAGIDVIPVVVKGTPPAEFELGIDARKFLSDVDLERLDRKMAEIESRMPEGWDVFNPFDIEPEANNELPSLTPEEDVLNEDIIPEIESAVANSRNYTPEEIAEINAFVAQREAINSQVEEAAGHLMTTNPADLQNLFAQLENINNEFYAKYPELFVNGKFAGMPKVDGNINPGYNQGIGGATNAEQVSAGYDGRGSNAVDTGIRESEPQDQGVDRTLQEGGVFLPDDRGGITEQLRSNQAVISPAESSALSQQGIYNQPFYDANNNTETFTQALATAKRNNPAGASVDGHNLEEIQKIIDNGGNCFLTDDATAGGAVEANGNLTCVFKDKLNNKTPNMGTAIALAGVKNGAVKGDCFGIFLVNSYSLAGFEPVARVNYAYGISDEMDAYVDEQIANGKIPGPPDVYAFKLRDGYDYDTAVAAYNDKTKAIAYTQDQLDELPLFEGEKAYDDMLAYRDSLLEGQSEQAASSVDENKGYFLRLLGDEDFLRNEALKYAYSQQQNGALPDMVENYMQQLRTYAAQNLGYDVPRPATNPVPNVQSGPTTPPPEVPHMDVDSSDTQKTSGYYNSTMRNTEANKDMSDSQYHQYFDEGQYQYTASTQARSVNDARSLITRLGGEDKAIEQLLNPSYFENNEFNHVYLDATEMLADAAEKRAMSLRDSGLDYNEALRIANRLHKLAQKNITNSAQVMQATKKWKVPSPRAQVDSLVGQINAAIDKGKTKGYSSMMSDLADSIEDAIVKGGTQQQILDRIHKIFEDNRSQSDYDTKKVEGLVARYIRNAEKKPTLAQDVARLVKKEMGVSTLSYDQEIAIAEMFEQAFQYEPDSRAYKELVGRALKMFDSTLPADKLSTKARSIIYDNMLASIRTMLTRNLGGNAVVNAIDFLERPVMVGADAVTGMFTKQRTRTLSGKAIIEGFKGFGHGAKDWALDIAHNVNTGRSGQDSIEELLRQNHNTFRTDSNNKIIKGANVVGYFYDRLVRKGMEAGDRTIYEMRYAATKAELMDVVDKFGDEGLRKGLGIKKDVKTEDLIEYIATGEALESVFQNDSQLKEAAKALKQVFKKSSESLIGVDIASLTMTPFIEVPSNMADMAFQHTIFGALGNIGRTIREKKKYGSFNQRRFTKEVGRNLSGIGLKAAGIGAAAAGLISGPLSDDPDEKKMQQNNGYQEYALQTPDGSTQVDISDIPILGPFTQYSKRIYDAFKEGGITGAVKEEVPALGAVTVDQLYQSLNRLTGSTNRYSTDKGGLLGNMGDAIATSAASMLTPSAVRQTAQYTDEYKRDLGDYGTGEYVKNLFFNGLPGLREKMLEPKVNTSGEYVPELNGKEGIQRFLSAYVTPWKVTNPTKDMSSSQKYIDNIREVTNGEVNPQLPVFNKKDLLQTKGYDKENYSHADLRELQENFYKTNTETSDRLIFEPWFKQLPYEKQGEYLDMLFSANKANAKEDIVRKGLSEAEIEALGDQIYTTDDKLAQILRTDDNAHSGMIQYFKDLEALDAINQKYGTKISYSDYKEREAKRKGGTEIFAQDKVEANRLGVDLNEYRGLKDYPGGPEKGIQDKKDAQWYGLSLDQYNKFADKAGSNFEQAKNDFAQLKRLGFNNYNVALDYARSTDLTIPEFADLFRQIDVENRNQVLSQKEVKDFLNAHPEISDEEAQKIWAIGGFKSEDGTQDTLLYRNKNNKWTSGYPKK